MRISVAEKQRELRDVLLRQPAEYGCAVDACENAYAGKDCLEAADYDLVILDIGLPENSGMDLLAWIRERDECSGTHADKKEKSE